MINKSITVAHAGDFLRYPPVISLLENMLANGRKVHLVSSTPAEKIPVEISKNDNFIYHYVTFSVGEGVKDRLSRLLKEKRIFRKTVATAMEDSDILWTTTDITVKVLGDVVIDYKHVMQLMELRDRYPLFLSSKHFSFPIDEYARKAYKVVVPNLDRAYIQQSWWNLEKVPVVLPNKPYSIAIDGNVELDVNEQKHLEKIKNEKRKVILYSGLITPERNIEDFAKAIQTRKDYCIYVMGKNFSDSNYLDKFLNENKNVEYLGYFVAPKHLSFIKYAHIGLTPYVPTDSSKLNALYCAPNKVYEYSAFGVPMLGTNVLGLLRPFEQYNIGKVAKNMSKSAILESLKYIDKHHDEMSKAALDFFAKDNLDEIVRSILDDSVE